MYSASAGLLSADGHTLALLVFAVSMILTPLMVKAGDRLAGRLRKMPAETGAPLPLMGVLDQLYNNAIPLISMECMSIGPYKR